jgi:hypothetical protein
VASLDDAVDRLVGIYERALAERAAAELHEGAIIAAQRAAARHLAKLALHFKHAEHRIQSLSSDLDTAHLATERALTECNALFLTERDALSAARDNLLAERDALAAERHLLHQRLARESGDRRLLGETYQALASIRLRDAMLRVPVLGTVAHRIARLVAPPR